ncbi:MAG: BrnT family toxin [Rickettsiales bacterium]
MTKYYFEWDGEKDVINQKQHGVSFIDAQEAFYDKNRIIANDDAHSEREERLFCIGKTPIGILTVRFTIRGNKIRIIGAGIWRKWRKFYEKEQQ